MNQIKQMESMKCWYLGRRYPMKFIDSQNNQPSNLFFEAAQACFVVSLEEKDKQSDGGLTKTMALLKRFYVRETKRLVEGIAGDYQTHFPKRVKCIHIKDSLTFWGQCNGKQELTFQWKLAMVPMDVIEYVVIHEMCHMIHLNHDRSFWRLVGKYCPEYEAMQDQLAWFERQF